MKFVLSSSTDRTLWLKPGTRLCIGRTHPSPQEQENGTSYHAIQDKSVSRKHLVVEVKAIEPGAGTRIHEKSTLTITDDSKLGTTLDGESFKKEAKTLKGNEHAIRLGRFESEFKIRWRPVVLTVTSLNRTQKSTADPLSSTREKLEKYDIKLSLEYIPYVTTHVVATKRNIPPTLCALIEGRHVVTDAFVDALAETCASQPNDTDPQNPLQSPLEQDLESNWPSETQYLPPPGKEPVTRGPEYFAPKPERSNVFEGYTFVFVDPNQFESLQPIIATGGGKAAVYERFQKNASGPEEFVEFVKQKNHGAWMPGQGKGPVVVRFEIKPDDQWGHQFCNDADIALGQRSIKQNEFLDAILLNDASTLRKPLEETIEPPRSTAPAQLSSNMSRAASRSAIGTSSVPPPPSQSSVAPRELEQTAASLQQTTTTLPPRRQRRLITESRFKGFDDFDIPAVPPRRAAVPESDDEISDDHLASDVPETSQPSRRLQTQGRKRLAPRSYDEISDDAPVRTKRTRRDGEGDEEMRDAEDVVEQLLPATAAMRRKKTQTQTGDEKGNSGAFHKKTDEELAREREKARLERARRKRDRNAEINVEEEVRKRRQREIEAAEAEEERVRRELEGVDVNELRDLAEIEEMKPPSRLMERVSGDTGDRSGSEPRNGREWREEWNGRKNFKGFRPKRKKGESQGQNNPPRQRIIIALEEVKKKSFGIGEEYWGESRSDGKRSQERRKTSQVESQKVKEVQRDGGEEGEDSQFRRSKTSKSQSSAAKSQSQRTAKSTPRSAVIVESDHFERLPDDPMTVQPPQEHEQAKLPPQTDHSLRSRVTETQISKGAGSPETQRKKRPARETVGSEPPSKKGRRKRLDSEEDSDEDGLRFRRKRR